MNPIKLTIITEDEPFYIAEAFNYFLSHLPEGYEVNFVTILNYFHTNSPNHNKIKIQDIFQVFGPIVFLRSLWRLFKGRLKNSKKVVSVFKKRDIPIKTGVLDINSPEVLQLIKHHSPDFVIAVGVNSVFQKPLRELAKRGCINVHTGIKPEHKGRASIFWALADGHNETGVTIHFIDDNIDAGKILTTSHYTIEKRSFDKVCRDLRFLGMNALIDALLKLRHEEIPQDVPTEHYKIKFRSLPKVADLKAFAKAGNKIF